MRLESAVSQYNETESLILTVLTDYFHFSVQTLPSFGLSERQQITELKKRLADVEAPSSITKITFNQGRESVNSRLLNLMNNNEN